MDINFNFKLNRQSISKYETLMNSIAISSLACFGLIYLGGGTLKFSEVISMVIFGDTVAVDLVFLIINCIANFLMILLPVKLFRFMQSGAYIIEEYLPVKKNILDKKTLPCVFLLGLAATYIVALINNGIANALFDYSGNGDDYLWRVGLKYNYQILIYVFSTAVIPAITEEIFCRKVLCDALEPYGPKTAILISSLVFSLLHANFSMFLYTFVGGIFMGWLYVGTKNIKITMFHHFVHNLLAAIEIIILYRVSKDAYYAFLTARTIISLLVGIICVLYLAKCRADAENEEVVEAKSNGTYEEYIEHKKKYSQCLEMLPGEDGEEITSLTGKEKIKGYFSPFMILYIVVALILAVTKIA